MAKRQLNKNVIMGLTIGAMVLVISAVGATAYSSSQRDPLIYVKHAADAEKAGDWKRAADQFKRAFKAGKNAIYLVEAARCEYERGEFVNCLNMLRYAHAQSPQDAKVLVALLQHFWDVRSMGLLPNGLLGTVRDFAEKLIKIEPDNVLALVSLADAITSDPASDAAALDDAEKHIARALELDPASPRVALVRSGLLTRRELAKLAAASSKMSLDAFQSRVKAIYRDAADLLRAAIKDNKTEARLVITLAEDLRVGNQEEEAIQTLQQAATDMPDREEIHSYLARCLLERVENNHKELSDEQKLEWLVQAIQEAERGLALESGMYQCYTVKAHALRYKFIANGVWDTERLDRQQEILDVFAKAQAATAIRTSLRAKMADFERAQMCVAAADLAILFYQTAPDDKCRARALEYARQFQTQLQNDFKDWVYRHVTDARMAQIDNDPASAIKAYKRAEELVGRDMNLARGIKEQLAGLYLNSSPGLALRYADEALDLCRQTGALPGRDLCWQRTALLLTLDRPQDALDYLDALDREKRFPNDSDLRNLRARASAMSGHPEAALASLNLADDFLALLERSRIAATGHDLAAAEDSIRRALDLRPDDARAIRLFVQIMQQAERKEECAKKLQELSAATQNAQTRLLLDTFGVLLTKADPAEQETAMLEVISRTPDACDRASELTNFWWSRKNWEKVSQYLAELAKCRGENAPEVLISQFNLALRMKKLEDADKAAVKLAAQNLDRANGSTFRGEIKIARNDLPGALAEFRNAERELPGDLVVKLKVAEALLRCTPPRLQDAEHTLKQALEYNPRSFETNRLLYAVLDELGGQSELALQCLNMASKINPNDPYVAERKKLLDEQTDPKSGIEWRTKLRQEKPDDMNNLARLVELYEKTGDKDKAEECLKEALGKSEKPTLGLATITARFFGAAHRQAEGEQFLRGYIAGCEGVDKLDGLILLGRFYEYLVNNGAALNAYLDCEKQIDALAGQDAELKRRARLIVSSAKADFYGRMKQFAQMADEYRTALSNLPTEPASQAGDLRAKLVKALLANNQTEEAEREIERFTKDFPKDIRGSQLKAELLLRRGMTDKSMDEARELLNKVLTEQPNNTFALLLRGILGIKQRHYEEARVDLVRCKTIDPTAFNNEPRIELARLYETTGQPASAEQELRELVSEKPADRPTLMHLIEFFQRTQQHDKGQALVSQQIAAHPDEPFWHQQIGRLMVMKGEPAAAVAELRKAYELSQGGDADITRDWLHALTLAHRESEVVTAIPQLNPAAVDSKVLRETAEAYLHLRMKKEAMEQFDKALALAAGRLVDEAGEVVDHIMSTVSVEDAIASIRRTIEAAAKDMATNLRLRLVLARALILGSNPDQRAEGLKLADDVLAEAPPRSKMAVSSLLVRALGLEVMGDSKAAVKTYERALDISPEAVQALNNVAYLLADRLNQPKQALPYAEEAARVTPGNSDVQDTVGWIQHLLGNDGQAESSLLEAIRLNPNNLAALFHLGKVYELLGRSTDARNLYLRVAERCKVEKNSPYCAEAQEALSKLK